MKVLEYLNKDYKYLSNDIKELNKILFKTPHSAIIKGRIISENIVKEVAKQENYEWLDMMNQYERINKLKSEGVLEGEILDLLDEVRRIGNKAAHANIEGELASALNIHKSIYKIACWFVEVYCDHKFITPPYEDPTPSQLAEDKNLAIDQDMIKTLLEKIRREEIEKDKKNISIISSNERDIKCLVQSLCKLRESSKEAVEGLNKFTDFKKYMHIEREAQRQLKELIFKANESKKAQLILVSGSVGDGKSHIISYFNEKYPDIMRNFILHNDATESLEPNQTSADTLNKVLDDFSDEKIYQSDKKIILAINLGTLNNFIDSEYGERFTVLKRYVHDKKILETNIDYNNFDEESHFQFINFSDYHIFTLKDGKVCSDYIESLITKITDASELNVFHNSYKRNCSECKNYSNCPVRSNYELLSSKIVQQSVIDLLVEAVIKNKIIISTRALINFIYELIVPISYIDVNSPTLKSDISELNNLNYIKSLMPNIIFNHKELSFIFEALYSLDPIDTRNQEVDDFIIEFNNSYDSLFYFKEYIDFPKDYMKKIEESSSEKINNEKIKHELLKLFIRSFYICGKKEMFSLKDKVYEEYMQSVYFWNRGKKLELKNLYDNVKNGILRWNGEADKDQINIFIGRNQNKYKVSQDIELKPVLRNLFENDDIELDKFITILKLQYKSEKSEETYKIDVDFSLYKLLTQINKGYRPNKKDKNQFVNFIEFINKLEETGSQNHKLIFTEKNREDNKKYKLEYDYDFEFYRFMEI